MAKSLFEDRVSDAELAVLKALWKSGQASAREVHESIDEESRRSYSATRAALERLVMRRLVVKRKDRHANRYDAEVSRTDFVAAEVRRLARDVIGVPSIDLMPAFSRSPFFSEDELVLIEAALRED